MDISISMPDITFGVPLPQGKVSKDGKPYLVAKLQLAEITRSGEPYGEGYLVLPDDSEEQIADLHLVNDEIGHVVQGPDGMWEAWVYVHDDADPCRDSPVGHFATTIEAAVAAGAYHLAHVGPDLEYVSDEKEGQAPEAE